jgi:hypothetical protein
MAFKLIDAAQERWRAANAPHLVALVRAGARFDFSNRSKWGARWLMDRCRPRPPGRRPV